MRLLFYVLCLVISTAAAHASPLPTLENQLREDWLTLNYYQPKGRGFQSEITNPDYFMADNGRTNPDAEFQAFLTHLQNTNQPQSAQLLCRYPARITLVQKHLPWARQFKRPACPEFTHLSDIEKVQSLSLVFASGYFESPASYFGHTMLKFNYRDGISDTYMIDSAINYGATITDNPGNPMYIVNGLTGGYNAGYKRDIDFLNTHSYTNKQMRDVWEYPLNLTPGQVTFIVEHVWELRRAQFDYYFFTDNCAHRIIRLVEMSTGSKLVNTQGKWLLPVQVVQELNGSPPIVIAESHHISLKSEVRRSYTRLPRPQQRAFASFINASVEQQQQQVSNLSDEVLALSLKHFDVKVASFSNKPKKLEDLTATHCHRQVVLAEMFRRNLGFKTSDKSPQLSPPNSPQLSPATIKHPSYLQIGYLVRPKESAALLRYQAANNDLLTPPFTGQEASRFIMGALEVAASGDIFSLHRVTFLDMASLNTNPIPGPLTEEYSWSLRAEYAPRNNICRKCSSLGLDAKLGLATRLNEYLMLYSLVGGQLNSRQTSLNDYLMLTTENGLLANLGQSTRLNAGLDAEVSPFQGNPAWLAKATLAHDLAPQQDVRLTLENDGDDTAALLKYGFYFN